MAKDWTGNTRSAIITNGGRNYTKEKRAHFDYYATEPEAVRLLLEREKFSSTIWECACGEKHISNVLEENGYKTKNSDLIVRGEQMKQLDFLAYNPGKLNEYDIITNPPYKYAREFIEHAIEISKPQTKIAMFLKLTFLESKDRYNFFKKNPPQKLYVFSRRMHCGKNGIFDKRSNAIAYGWYIWRVGWKGDPIIKWIKP